MTPVLAPALPTARVRAATRATYIAFAGSGFAFASWASRIPQVRDRLHLQPSALGLVLLAIAAGSIVSLVLSGPIIARFGSRRAVSVMAVLLGAGLALAGAGYLVGVLPVVTGLFVLGFANGAWDVAMNVQGAVVERHLGRSIMARFHAGFSLGTVAGALVGAGMVALGVPVTAHLLAVGAAVVIVVPLGARSFVPDVEEPVESGLRGEGLIEDDVTSSAADLTAAGGGRRGLMAAWFERRTLLIGLFVMAFAFAEGAGNDWISVALIDGHGASAAVGTLGFAAFLTAMTLGRWFGPALLDRYGRVLVVRALVLVTLAGVLVFVLGPGTPFGFAGALLWGLGASLGFPVGMSAGADEPEHAATRVSVIASIGYCAFLAGPPLIGFLGDRVTVLSALLAVVVLMAAAALPASGATRPVS